jgi:hypothetical protein
MRKSSIYYQCNGVKRATLICKSGSLCTKLVEALALQLESSVRSSLLFAPMVVSDTKTMYKCFGLRTTVDLHSQGTVDLSTVLNVDLCIYQLGSIELAIPMFRTGVQCGRHSSIFRRMIRRQRMISVL